MRYTVVMLTGLDLLVLLKIAALGDERWGQAQVAGELGISQSSVSSSLRQAQWARLYRPDQRAVQVTQLEEALVHGAKYFLAVQRGGLTRGMATSWAGPPMNGLLTGGDEPPPVWPDPEGNLRGLALEPIYPSAPRAAKADPTLYELLVLVDVLREGRARESAVAAQELGKRLRG